MGKAIRFPSLWSRVSCHQEIVSAAVIKSSMRSISGYATSAGLHILILLDQEAPGFPIASYQVKFNTLPECLIHNRYFSPDL